MSLLLAARAKRVFIFQGVLLLGCAGLSTQVPPVTGRSDQELIAAMSSPAWKGRCRAADACGQTLSEPCFERLQKLIIEDDDERVQACALRAVAARCGRGQRSELLDAARDLLGRVAWSPDEPPSPVFLEAFASAVAACPSADAALSLAAARDPVAVKVLTRLGAGKPPEAKAAEWPPYLELIARLPSPRWRTKDALEAARARVAGVQELRDVDGELDAAPSEDTDQETELMEKASAALLARDPEAFAMMNEAERLGEDTTALRPNVEKLKQEFAQEHFAKAWSFVRTDEPDDAELELRLGETMGGHSPGLAEAIEETPTMRRRRQDETQEGRRRAREAEEAERARVAREQAEERERRQADALAEKEQAAKRARVRSQTGSKRGKNKPKCGVMAGTITQKLGKGRYELLFFTGFRHVRLIMTTDEPIYGTGEASFWCAYKIGTQRVQLQNGFTAEWEVWHNDHTRRWTPG